ncbi:AbrB/MazE/SpoVT family DNA-binding domain-containing protein [Saccharopolyspora shandongensis]|uniref:AbrB/MazE/SpoVT family DNA-binding domain-containing protein n=1 Tax=Saccharopolyspora shandongensis TaxID=418495 RepID=UPI0034105608
MATVDARGRVSDRSAVRALQWTAGLRLEIRAVSGSILVRPSQDGLFTLTRQSYVRLPAAARHWCALQAGEKVLLVAEPHDNTLLIHTMSTVEALVTEYHARLLGGEAS